ncbi:MAG: tyrosine-type recombinase/integrase [Bacteroidetes bacterium]|nr:tyrosine-type recombinase/integrase [Bacteroidota bacterium]
MKKFNSLLGSDMDSFLRLKESLGYSRGTYNYQLIKIDEYALSHFPQIAVMNETFVLGWSKKHPEESKNNRRIRLHVIREFGKFQQIIKRDAYVLPTDYIDKQQAFIPYLFTDDELTRLFREIDSFSASKHSPKTEYVLPVLFRMIYCCALRPGEPLKLLREDVNLEKGTLFIRESKRHKDRIVRMPEDLIELCTNYDSFMEMRPFFFTSPKGDPYKRQWMDRRFQLCCKKSKQHDGQQKPRIYDLRHSSCSRVILKWLEEDIDFYALAPFLREHMGHSDFESTFTYIHLLPENIIKNAGIDWDHFNSLYPEVLNEET